MNRLRARRVLAALVVTFGTLFACGDDGGNGLPREGAVLHFESTIAVTLGESTDVCVTLTGGAERIAGLQMNLRWDNSCVTPSDGIRPCRSRPESNKTVQSARQGRDELKALLISFDNVDPIPDGPLLCCPFTAVGNQGTECRIQAHSIIGSTSTGVRIDDIRVGEEAVVSIVGGLSEVKRP